MIQRKFERNVDMQTAAELYAKMRSPAGVGYHMHFENEFRDKYGDHSELKFHKNLLGLIDANRDHDRRQLSISGDIEISDVIFNQDLSVLISTENPQHILPAITAIPFLEYSIIPAHQDSNYNLPMSLVRHCMTNEGFNLKVYGRILFNPITIQKMPYDGLLVEGLSFDLSGKTFGARGYFPQENNEFVGSIR